MASALPKPLTEAVAGWIESFAVVLAASAHAFDK